MSSNVPAEQWKQLKTVYAARASLPRHKEASSFAARLAGEYPGDRQAQLFSAATAYYCAHRVKDHKEKRGIASRGIDAANRVLATDATDYDGRYWLALNTFQSRMAEGIAAGLKEAKKIRSYLDAMVKDHPDRPEAYMSLGVLYRELPPLVSWGDKKKALMMLEKSAQLAPKDPEVLLELAAALKKNGRKKEARQTYQRVISDTVAPENKEWETADARDYARKMLNKLFF